jgi:hypothetical protein
MSRYRYIDENRQHLHTLDGKPLLGTSTVVKIIGKGDGLIKWAANCAAEYCEQNLSRLQDVAEWQMVIEEARTAHVRKRDGAAEKGTERHGLLEDFVRDTMNGVLSDRDYRPIQPFIDWANLNVEKFLFTEANCYSEKMWVGGIADIGMLLKDGRRVVGDHKSGPRAYFDQFLQCAIYDMLLSESGGLTPDGEKLFDWKPADGYVVFPFRSRPFTPEFRWDVDNFHKGVEAAVHLYKLQNN